MRGNQFVYKNVPPPTLCYVPIMGVRTNLTYCYTTTIYIRYKNDRTDLYMQVYSNSGILHDYYRNERIGHGGFAY